MFILSFWFGNSQVLCADAVKARYLMRSSPQTFWHGLYCWPQGEDEENEIQIQYVACRRSEAGAQPSSKPGVSIGALIRLQILILLETQPRSKTDIDESYLFALSSLITHVTVHCPLCICSVLSVSQHQPHVSFLDFLLDHYAVRKNLSFSEFFTSLVSFCTFIFRTYLLSKCVTFLEFSCNVALVWDVLFIFQMWLIQSQFILKAAGQQSCFFFPQCHASFTVTGIICGSITQPFHLF